MRIKKYNDFLFEKENKNKLDLNLSKKEKEIVDDILSTVEETNESINFNKLKDKLKSYSKKGLLTVAVLMTLLSSPAFANVNISGLDNINTSDGLEKKDNVYVAQGIGVSPDKEISLDKALINTRYNLSEEFDIDIKVIKGGKILNKKVTKNGENYVTYVIISYSKDDIAKYKTYSMDKEDLIQKKEKSDYVIEKDDKYIVHGRGESTKLVFSKDKAAFDSRSNLASYLNKKVNIKNFKILKEKTKKQGNKIITYITIEYNKDDIYMK